MLDPYRRQALALRDALPPDLRKRHSGRIARQILSSERWQAARTVFCYVSVGSEVDTRTLLDAALAAGKRLLTPRCRPGGSMDACSLDALTGLCPGRYGIPEPPREAPPAAPGEIDLALVPGLAFDRSGGRIGFGCGYYDRFLAQCPAFRVGLCFPEQVRTDLSPAAPWDQRMHALALPHGIETISQEGTIR